jgi:hypothetical protein
MLMWYPRGMRRESTRGVPRALIACAGLGVLLLIGMAVHLLQDLDAPAPTSAPSVTTGANDLPDLPDESTLPRRRRGSVVDVDLGAYRTVTRPGNGRVFGRVLVARVDELSSISVILARKKAGAPRSPTPLSGRCQLVGPPEHRFEFADVEPGSYELNVWRESECVARTDVEVQGETLVEVELPRVRDDESLIVHVLDDKGSPLENMSFQLSYATGIRGVGQEAQADGSYRVGPSSVITEALAGSRNKAMVQISRDDVGAQSVPINAGQRELTVVFTLSSRAELVVDVADYTPGKEHERVVVVIERSASRDPTQLRFRTESAVDGSGRAHFERVEPGEWDVKLVTQVAGAGHGGGSLSRLLGDLGGGVQVPVARAHARLEPGSNRLRLTMPPLYTLTVYANLWSDGEVTISRTDDREAPAISRGIGHGPGSVTFALLPAGRYQVRTSENGTVVVVIPDRTEVRFPRR